MKNSLFISCVLPLCTFNISHSMFTVTNPPPKKELIVTEPKSLLPYRTNICYGNAVIQLLFAIESLRSFFLNNKNPFAITTPKNQVPFPTDEIAVIQQLKIASADLEKKIEQNVEKNLRLLDHIATLNQTNKELTEGGIPIDDEKIQEIADLMIEVYNVETITTKLRAEKEAIDQNAIEPKKIIQNAASNYKAFLPSSFVFLAKALGKGEENKINETLNTFQDNASEFMALQTITAPTDQQDASELLIPLLDQMQEQSYSQTGKIYNKLQIFFPFTIHSRQGASINAIQGQVLFTTNKSNQIISLENAIQEVFHDPTTDTIISFDNKPLFVIFYIPRFSDSKKDETPLVPPLEIDLTSYITNAAEAAIYSLRSAITHLGKTAQSGHYVTYASYNDAWWRCSDSLVEKATANDLDNELTQASILVYELRAEAITIPAPLSEEVKSLEQSLERLNKILEEIANELRII